MAVNSPDKLRGRAWMFDAPWFRNGVTGRNRDGERVLLVADLDTPVGEVLDVLQRSGGTGNLIVFHDANVTTLVIEEVPRVAANGSGAGCRADATGTVAAFLETYRATMNPDDEIFTFEDGGSRRGIRATGFQREPAAA